MKPDFLTDVAIALVSEADPEHAPAMRAYMRDQFDFIGVGTPERRGACRALLKTLKGEPLLEYARALWELPQREYQYVALDLLAMHWKELNTEDIPALLELVQDKSWWDTVDALAGIIGDVLRHGHDYMDECLAIIISGCAASLYCTNWAGEIKLMSSVYSIIALRWPMKKNSLFKKPSAGH
jgi:3-methyladenine DNA glycosylase AlkD